MLQPAIRCQLSLAQAAGVDASRLPTISGLPAERRAAMIKGGPLLVGSAHYFAPALPAVKAGLGLEKMTR